MSCPSCHEFRSCCSCHAAHADFLLMPKFMFAHVNSCLLMSCLAHAVFHASSCHVTHATHVAHVAPAHVTHAANLDHASSCHASSCNASSCQISARSFSSCSEYSISCGAHAARSLQLLDSCQAHATNLQPSCRSCQFSNHVSSCSFMPGIYVLPNFEVYSCASWGEGVSFRPGERVFLFWIYFTGCNYCFRNTKNYEPPGKF